LIRRNNKLPSLPPFPPGAQENETGSFRSLFQLVKKVHPDFFDKLGAKLQNKSSILFRNFGRCGG